jgi:hypothetical protein
MNNDASKLGKVRGNQQRSRWWVVGGGGHNRTCANACVWCVVCVLQTKICARCPYAALYLSMISECGLINNCWCLVLHKQIG